MNYVFSYGTLIEKFPQERISAVLTANLELGSYGNYPALLVSKVSKSINGFLIELTDEQFKESDRYEDYPQLYYRRKMNVVLDDGSEVRAWVYILNE